MKQEQSTLKQWKDVGWTVWTLLWVVMISCLFIGLISWNQHRYPLALDEQTLQFSGKKAYQHLTNITTERHPFGSVANKRVAQYILQELNKIQTRAASRNVTVEIIESDSLNTTLTTVKNSKIYFQSSNILARIVGENKSSFLVSAHYDSVPSSYGATDDGAGIAIMLETLSMMTQSRHKYSTIFVFNNAEEIGLLGSRSFIQHPWVENVEGFINLEGAGAGGREMVFRSTHTDLMRIYAQSVPYPHGSSLASDIFASGIIPSETDYYVYTKEKGLCGLDMSFYERYGIYHTSKDTLEEIQPGSLQRAGSNVLAFLRHMATVDRPFLSDTSPPVYFDILGLSMVVLSLDQFRILNIITLCLYVMGIVFHGIQLRRTCPKNQPMGPRLARKYIQTLSSSLLVICGWIVSLVLITIASFLVGLAANPLAGYAQPFVMMTLFAISFYLAFSTMFYLHQKMSNQRRTSKVQLKIPPRHRRLSLSELNSTEQGKLELLLFPLTPEEKTAHHLRMLTRTVANACTGFWFALSLIAQFLAFYSRLRFVLYFSTFWLLFGIVGYIMRKVMDSILQRWTKGKPQKHSTWAVRTALEAPWVFQFIVAFVFPALITIDIFLVVFKVAFPLLAVLSGSVVAALYIFIGILVCLIVLNTLPFLARMLKPFVALFVFLLLWIIFLVAACCLPVFLYSSSVGNIQRIHFEQAVYFTNGVERKILVTLKGSPELSQLVNSSWKCQSPSKFVETCESSPSASTLLNPILVHTLTPEIPILSDNNGLSDAPVSVMGEIPLSDWERSLGVGIKTARIGAIGSMSSTHSILFRPPFASNMCKIAIPLVSFDLPGIYTDSREHEFSFYFDQPIRQDISIRLFSVNSNVAFNYECYFTDIMYTPLYVELEKSLAAGSGLEANHFMFHINGSISVNLF